MRDMLKKTKKKTENEKTITTLQNYATLVSRKNHKNRLFVMKDMMKCKKIYGCSYQEYYYYRFDTLTDDERKTYITEKKNQLLQKEWNQKADVTFWNHKTARRSSGRRTWWCSGRRPMPGACLTYC